MTVILYKGKKPEIAEDCFIADNARVIGQVSLGSGSSVWFGAVLRGDLNAIKVGRNVSVQDNCVLHTESGIPTVIHDSVAIGHGAILHSAKVGSNTIIGMGAILLSGSEIGRDCIIGAGSVVTEGTKIPDGSIAIGSPAKVVKQTSPGHRKRIKENIAEYAMLAKTYR
jgi:carbonic anhydrase/acetyltransferase-like protein (isoleucine patch superfamily)